MFQNIKLDIIYFDTNTDFEMEFNLCGCCRMRLLTDKTDDQKNFLHMLARGVSRSRVIIIIGKLFGENGIINLSAQAIGKSLTEADNKLFGISSDEKIEIINNSTPLVTSEGYFGGCIIESGPQTMIMLSDNKNIRKNIMNTLIHPYIEELSALELQKKAESANAPSNTPDETEVITEEVEENSYIPEEEVLEEYTPEEDIELEGNMEYVEYIAEEPDTQEDLPPENPMDSMLYIEPEKVKFSKKSYYEENYMQAESEKYIFESNEDFKRVNTSKKIPLNGVIFAITVILLIIIAVLAFTVFFIPISSGLSPAEFIGDTFKTLFGSTSSIQ